MSKWCEFGGVLINLDQAAKIKTPQLRESDNKWFITLEYSNREDLTLTCYSKQNALDVYDEIRNLVLAKPYVIPFKLLE